MKKIIIAVLAIGLVSLGAIFIFAQKGGGMRRGGGGGGFGSERGFMRMAEKLNLSDEQKTRVKQIMEDSKTRVKPLMESLRAGHQEVENLGTDGTFNEAEVQKIAASQAETTRQLIIEKEKTKAQIFAVLTPEQRAQAAEMKEQFKENFKGKFKKRFGEKEKTGETQE